MKRIKTIGIIFTMIIIIFGCEELKDPAGLRGVAVIPAITNINPAIFDSKDLENSYIEFTVDLLGGAQVENAIIVGSYDGNLERVEIIDVSTFPSTIRILSSDVAQKLGIALGDIQNGKVFAFELVTTSNGTIARSNSVINVPVACAYDKELAIGSYHSVSAGWATDGDITISVDPDDPFTVYVKGLEEIEGVVEDLDPLVMHINPIDYSVIADETTLASDFFGYGSVTYSGTGVYNSCDGSYNMNFDISIGTYGSQGVYNFIITRNP
jgi:hypothetical protein